MSSTLEQIKVLREKTGAGLGSCKKALAETNNDIEAAVVVLRKKGLADMAKRADKQTNEGQISIKISDDGKTYAMSYLGCETDFVAKTPDFIALSDKVADFVLNHPTVSDYATDSDLSAIIAEVAPKFGENVTLKNAVCWQASDNSIINYYLHTDKKKAAFVEVSCQDGYADKKEQVSELARNLAMQGVGMVAQYLEEKDVPQADIDREKDIAITQAKEAGKPEAAIEKMIPGRVNKFFKEICLLDQPSLKDSKVQVKDYVSSVGKELGLTLKVEKFIRF